MLMRAFTLATLFMISACAQVTTAPHQSPPSEEIRASDTVVNLTGIGEIKFGLKRADLARYLNTDLPGCNTQLRSYPQGSLVFTQDDQLVLMWFNAPLRTAEGIATGTTLDAVKAAYPKATDVKAPQGSHRFDGVMVSEGEYGYLFLHNGKTVQKAIAGYTDYLHRLFESGFGVC
ncbi:MAG TPA: hypothetical protein VFC19_45655 [Candidatus Limnocylindrales bacterium]|nr:hypothetical protein [Candidatus Limnocylindrales bacterium]